MLSDHSNNYWISSQGNEIQNVVLMIPEMSLYWPWMDIAGPATWDKAIAGGVLQ